MTDRHIMTPEEAAQLPMPEGLKLTYSERDCEWLYSGEPGPCAGLAILAATVADGYFPREVLDHAWAAHRGEEWVRNPRVAEKLKARGLRITELEQQLGYERAKRSQAETQLADWPKERRDAALELARLVRCNGGDVGTMQVGHICDIIDRLPAIAPCPRCGARCIIMEAVPQYAECINCDCLWRGPHGETVREAIEAHNREAALLTGGAK